MHQRLKARTTRPPAATYAGQQRKLVDFQVEYNFERPHEALSDETPGLLWVPSSRVYPTRLGSPEYPGHFEVRRVSNAGEFKVEREHRFFGQALNRVHRPRGGR